MERRNRLACDQCHVHKIKCVPTAQSCARCQRLKFSCTTLRSIGKRGRPTSAVTSLSSPPDCDDVPSYPVLNCLNFSDTLADGNDELFGETLDTRFDRYTVLPLSRSTATTLLEHFFLSPEQTFLISIIRRHRLLHKSEPRATEPVLLLAIICLSCYLPGPDHRAALPHMSAAQLNSLRRRLLSQLMNHAHHITHAEAELTFDKTLTAFIITAIGPTEETIHSNLLYWLSFFKYAVKKMSLCSEPPGLTIDDREERRRLWWSAYIIDRHSALSLNLRPQFTDDECLRFPIPYSDDKWARLEAIDEEEPQYPSYEVTRFDMSGCFLPLSMIIGDILEYHFLCRNPTYNAPQYTSAIRENILQHLRIWLDSFSKNLPPKFCEIISITSEIPALAYYALYLYHCLHILLYGQMDLIRMYEDTGWQASSDFLVVGEHAIVCANIASCIIQKDPHLHFLHRFFGTYLLQSSFIFVILAKKLGPDPTILQNCATNLKVLNVFAESANMKYQRDFANVLKRILRSEVLGSESAQTGHGGETGTYSNRTKMNLDDLDPELRKYRWVAGYSGLWA